MNTDGNMIAQPTVALKGPMYKTLVIYIHLGHLW